MKQLTEIVGGFEEVGVALAVGFGVVGWLVGEGDFFGSFLRYWLLGSLISPPLSTRRVGLELEHSQLFSVEQDPVLSEHCPG